MENQTKDLTGTENGITLTGRDWSIKVGLGINTVNKYIRQYGLDKTKLLIQAILEEGLKPRKSKQNYFEVYNIDI